MCHVWYWCPDLEKQQAMNVFLGVFRPRENEPGIWDVPTDFYLHNPDCMGTALTRKWWVGGDLDDLNLFI